MKVCACALWMHAAQFWVASREVTTQATHKWMDTQYVYHIVHLCMEYVTICISYCTFVHAICDTHVKCIWKCVRVYYRIDACSAIQSRVSRHLYVIHISSVYESVSSLRSWKGSSAGLITSGNSFREIAGLFRMAAWGHVETLTPRTWERRRASCRCVRRGKCRSMKMRVLETERTSSPNVNITTYIQPRGASRSNDTFQRLCGTLWS